MRERKREEPRDEASHSMDDAIVVVWLVEFEVRWSVLLTNRASI
jgi:hypothetical protein